MSLRKCLLLVLLTTVFLSVGGNQAEYVLQVKVKVGDTAALPCDVSAWMSGEDSDDDLYIRWVMESSVICVFFKGKSLPDDKYINRTEISKEKKSKHLYHLIINETRVSDEGNYYCQLQYRNENSKDVAIIDLIIKGHEENVSVDFGKTMAIRLPAMERTRIRFTPASNSEAEVCSVKQNTLLPADAYASRAALKKNELRLDRITFADEGNYSVIDVGTKRAMKTVVLAVKGLVENHVLSEGENLSIPLCCLNSPYIEFCGPAGNSTAEGACQGHVERLTVQNGSLTLSNFTEKDHGKYIVWEKMGGRVILTFTLKTKPKTIPVRTQNADWRWMSFLIVPYVLALGFFIAVRHHKWTEKNSKKEALQVPEVEVGLNRTEEVKLNTTEEEEEKTTEELLRCPP